MAETNSRFFSLMVVGNNPQEIVKKYSSTFKVQPYVKYKYLDAKKYQSTAIKALTSIIDNADKIGLTPQVKESLSNRLKNLTVLSPFDYYRELTDGMYYDENGNALSEENPDTKYNTCRIGRNFCTPLKLKDGSESYSALAKDIDWEAMNAIDKENYEMAWELVVDKREPTTEKEKTIYDAMNDKAAYFANFKTKEEYVMYNTVYWNYAYADENGWIDIDDVGDEKKWVTEFYDRFIRNLNPNDLVSLFECSTNNS